MGKFEAERRENEAFGLFFYVSTTYGDKDSFFCHKDRNFGHKATLFQAAQKFRWRGLALFLKATQQFLLKYYHLFQKHLCQLSKPLLHRQTYFNNKRQD